MSFEPVAGRTTRTKPCDDRFRRPCRTTQSEADEAATVRLPSGSIDLVGRVLVVLGVGLHLVRRAGHGEVGGWAGRRCVFVCLCGEWGDQVSG